jgi:hypothetical protein
MQPYNMTPEEEAQEADYLARVARIAQLTDEDVRAMGKIEIYPGYFKDDPRHPYFTAEDRYLMDHPGPDWKTKERAPKTYRPYHFRPGEDRIADAWDEEQLFGQPTPTESLPPRPVPQIVPIHTGEAEQVIRTEYSDSIFESPKTRQSGFWICRICRKALARWPSERALRLKPFGLSITVVFRSPIACTNCRVFEFPTISQLGREDHRKFWQRVIACWEHPSLLIPRVWYQRARSIQKTLRNSLRARRNLF